MQTIEVDFDVFKELTNRRTSERDTYNDVLRRLLRLAGQVSEAPRQLWSCRGGGIEQGTKLRATYKGVMYEAEVGSAGIELNGKRYSSPSAAAIAVTGSNTNGWRFWEAIPPGATKWRMLAALR